MRVHFLGTGTSVGVPAIGCRCAVCASPDPLNRRLRTSAVVSVGERHLLIDASIDLRQQALRAGINRLDGVLLTHGHADHIFGLDDLRMYNYLQQSPVPVYGARDTIEDVKRTFWYVFAQRHDASSRPQLDLRPVDREFEIGPVRVVPFQVMHGTIPILGYRIGSFAYITDGSALPEASLSALTDLDVLVINALRRKPHPTHFTLDGALHAIARIAPRRAYLTHISHELDHASLAAEVPPGITPAHDGLTVEVEDP